MKRVKSDFKSDGSKYTDISADIVIASSKSKLKPTTWVKPSQAKPEALKPKIMPISMKVGEKKIKNLIKRWLMQ